MKRLTVIIFVLLTLCGCSSFGRNNITGLLSSPKHSQTESLIAQEIGDYLGENITLKYSSAQGYSAPIQFIDTDEDGTDEALVFYYAPNKGTNIRFAVLKYENDQWSIVFDKEGLGTDVFYFETVELQGLEGKQILTGYLTSNINENFFVTYFTGDSQHTEDYMETCGTIFVGEITGDGYDDVVLTNKLSDGKTRIKVLSYTAENGYKNAGSKILRRPNVEITQMTVSQTAEGQSALYVDYIDEYNRMYTEAGVVQGSSVVNCLSEDYVARIWGYSYRLNSFDIDSDGVQEIPTVIQDETAEEMSVLKFVEWTDYSSQQPVRKFWGVYDTAENIFTAVPAEWQNLVYTQYSTGSWQLCSLEEDIPLIKFEKQEQGYSTQKQDNSYSIDIGTDIWNIEFDESVDNVQMEYVLDNITAFG